MEEQLKRWIKLLKESGKDTKGQVLDEMQKQLELSELVKSLANAVLVVKEAAKYIIEHPELIEELKKMEEMK